MNNKSNLLSVFFLTAGAFLFSISSYAQPGSLKERIESLTSGLRADVGVAIYDFQDGESININCDIHYPMQSVFKLHIALAVLNEVDKGNLSLTDEININRSELLTDTWSPIRENYPGENVKLPLSEIIRYTVSESDNNGCDILLRLLGGTKKVNDYIHGLGIEDVAIIANEEEMHKEWSIQFLNWTTPLAATELLKLIQEGKTLSKTGNDFLWKIMAETLTGVKRIKGQLPEGTVVAHKTGTSGSNTDGMRAAVNDIGIVVLPSGKNFAISVFVSNSYENLETNEKIISDISKTVCEYFMSK